MGKKQIQKSLNIFAERVKKTFNPERVVLFGSYADDRATKYSDVDILVVSKTFSNMPYEKRFDALYDLTRGLRPDFHVYGLTPKEYEGASPLTIISEIKKHGINVL